MKARFSAAVVAARGPSGRLPSGHMGRPARVAILIILGLCGTVDYLDRNLSEPQVPAMFYGVVLSLIIWRVDRWLRKRRSNRGSTEASV
jgi:hypothetical protein